jgi:hypothetical protein
MIRPKQNGELPMDSDEIPNPVIEAAEAQAEADVAAAEAAAVIAQQPSPEAALAADAQIAAQIEETERARIRAETDVKIARLQAKAAEQEEPEWARSLREQVMALQARFDAGGTASQPSIPSPTVAITEVREPEAPTIVQTEPTNQSEGDPVEVTPEPSEPAPKEPATPRRRWI